MTVDLLLPTKLLLAIFRLITAGTDAEKAEVALLQIAIEASLAQPDSYRVGTTGEGGLVVPENLDLFHVTLGAAPP